MSEKVPVTRHCGKTMQRFSVDQVKSIWGLSDEGWTSWDGGKDYVHAAHGRVATGHVHIAVVVMGMRHAGSWETRR